MGIARRSSARPGSSATWARPSLIAATTASLTSTAMTVQPWEANCAASGRPILPAPDDGDRAGRPRLAGPRRDVPGRARGGTGSAGSVIVPAEEAGASSSGRVADASSGRDPRRRSRPGPPAWPRPRPAGAPVAIARAHRPSSPSTTGRPPSRATARNASSSAASGSPAGDVDARRRRPRTSSRSRRSACGLPTSALRERQPLGQVVELEHPLLADDRRAGAAWPGSASSRRASRSPRTGSGAARTGGPRGRRGSAGPVSA